MRFPLFLVIAALSLTTCGDATGPAEEDYAILFVGNSLTYTNDLPGILSDLLDAASDRERIVIESIAEPNYGLEDHWANEGTRKRISRGTWDVVVLQQGPSATEGRPSLLQYTALFSDPIREGGGVPALYMVWPAAERSFDFAGVRDAYQTAAVDVDGYFFPAGIAWQEAWKADPGLGLYGADGFHPSIYGTYLAAVVMYEQLAGRNALLLDLAIPARYGIDAEKAGILHAAAHDANLRYARVPDSN
ncbi:MAG: hypothetical protein R2834_11915 [Rhodothermales bacterium]